MRRRSGFTLLELIIVIAIIGLLLGAAVIAVGSLTGTKAKEASAELAGTIRLLYDSAALTGRTCRLVFEMPQPKDDDGKVKYHAECAKGALTASRDRDAELKEVERIRKENERNPRRAEQDRRYKPASDRIRHFKEFMIPLSEEATRNQAALESREPRRSRRLW